MEQKGFTLVELLVVIAVIALLMGILVPALGRARQLAYRVVCGTNLYGLGRAMAVYANDYGEKLPRAGGRSSTWGPLLDWQGVRPSAVYGLDIRGEGGQASIGSCFYLLVKYAEVTPKSFVCRGDSETTEFKLSARPAGTLPPGIELADLWDFGPVPDNIRYYSYSYHMPFGLHALKASGAPGLAVAADRNPWLRSPGGEAKAWPGTGRSLFRPDLAPYGGSSEQARNGNAIAHRNEGQNVLFLDGHVWFEKRPHCAIEEDNIFTISDRVATGSAMGTPPPASQFSPANRNDSVLVHDPGQWQNGPGPVG
jgi:prepilin-type N-terminal cleavage/methylation domain-containing protein/prepilin-type processing-associated H-X9-DG protein